MAANSKRALLVSKGWVQAVIIVLLFGFFVLGFLAYRTYTGEPPIPGRVTDARGRLLFTRAAILDGQEIFLRNGLMESASAFGHGAYLGPAATAASLHRAAFRVRNYSCQADPDGAQAQTLADFKTTRFEPARYR